ncbi:von Willebrand factor, type A [Sulfurimonas denitrificans DSM 1251]|uniref:von Willebrand factor, type A n=1 Tax=Sulfurimonas denitrificans (strain ATCC 33889 / DSM 1251) TaxID=326298 RepID=Q30SV3_SULDN|nr:VWA domain-containing protein [Sulfurimonas denitrificans]ABB43928.1 von Willebrand factor, type A [Sulfurimonas denitrificans DSM 1251]MDD3443585.1 VWA domain-containing protein [Sulfurimonas denitrificans]
MTLLYPSYLWLVLILALFFVKRDFREYRVTFYGYMLTFIFIVLALSRPVIEQEPIKSEQFLSDVIIAQDLSFSMYAQDIEPSRLAYSKQMLKKLLYEKQKSRFAVLGFTTNAIILSPLTEDRELLEHLFDSLDEKFIITKGSDVMSALKLAREISSSKRARVVIFSDGADKLEYSAEATFAKKSNLVVNIFMIASEIGGVLRVDGGELLKDESGDIVISRQNSSIKAIAQATGGVYTKDFDELLNALNDMDRDEYKSEVKIMRNIELFYYFIALAIITFLLSVTTLKRFLIMFLLLFGVELNADKNFNKAVEFYKAGEYESALENFEMTKSNDSETKSIIYYNIGNSLVRLKEFAKAREAYLKSLTLNYSLEADENLEHIIDADEEKKMSRGKEKSSDKSSLAKKQSSEEKQKEGGGSNMQVSAASSGAAENKGKKTEMQNSINLNSGKAKLSSKQYELINKRSVDEKKPW